MYTDVVVLTYQAPDINHFTYLVPQNLEKEIKVGQLVQVPFGKRSPMGVALRLKSHPERSEGSESLKRDSSSFDELRTQNDRGVVIKPISNIIFPQPILLPYQIELLKWMSFYYLAPMVNCLEAMLPISALNVKRLTANANTKYRIQNTEYQSIVLVPTINRIPRTLAQFPRAKNYVIYHSELKPAEKFATSRRLLGGGVDYIFGSRSAIFAPCPNLREIIIFNEHDGAYKDERSPYYDTLTVVQKIAQLTGAQIKIIDASPKISTYFAHSTAHARANPEVSIDFHLRGGKGTGTKIISIISMKEERLAGNFSPVSDFLLTKLKTSQNSLLFLNKKKEAGSLYCKSCKTHLYLEKQPGNCPNCGSSDIFFNVLNISSLAKVVQKQIPGAKINLISDSSHYPTTQLPNYPTVDIATASIFYAPLYKKYDLAAYISADSLLNRADFSSGEVLYQQIANLKSLLKDNGLLILQTMDTENLIIKSAASGNYVTYYNEQLKLRRSLFYPPFALLIKLTLKGKDQEKVESKAHEITNRLKYQIQNTKYKIPVTIIGPFPPFFFSKMPTFNIIIKYKLESFDLAAKEEAIKNLQHLRNLKDVRVEVEPESIN